MVLLGTPEPIWVGFFSLSSLAHPAHRPFPWSSGKPAGFRSTPGSRMGSLTTQRHVRSAIEGGLELKASKRDFLMADAALVGGGQQAVLNPSPFPATQRPPPSPSPRARSSPGGGEAAQPGAVPSALEWQAGFRFAPPPLCLPPPPQPSSHLEKPLLFTSWCPPLTLVGPPASPP